MKLDKNGKLAAFVRENLPKFIQGITHAEVEGAGQSGAEKLEIAAKMVAGLVDVPILPEFVEVLLIKGILTALVEVAKLAARDQPWIEWLLELMSLDDEDVTGE